jgi:hypothetical protein
MKNRLIPLIAFSILTGLGIFLHFIDAEFLTRIFVPDTGRELLRYVYADSLMLGGAALLLAVIFGSRIKRAWQEWLLSHHVLWGILTLVFIWLRAIYLAQAWSLAGALGFPVDDAWIHAVYARNFGNTFVLGFIAGIPDAGCSAPLWPIILAVGARLGMAAVWNAYLWANIFWVGALWVLYLLTRRLAHDFHHTWLILLAIAVQPMLVWSSLSGLETGLFVLLIYAALYFYSGSARIRWLGAIMVGLSGVVRAEGWILIGAFFAVDLFRKKVSFGNAVARLGLSILIVLPWIAHNYLTIGNVLPQTFYAKSSPFSWHTVLATLGDTAIFAFSPGMWMWTLLLPLAIWGWCRQRSGFSYILPLIITFLLYWCAVAGSVGFFWTYYRYLHPFIPLVIMFVMVGVYRLLAAGNELGKWLLGSAATFAVAAGIFAGTIYGYGVENIEHQQVAMAVWTRDNVPAEETVAANDVGAMGYFSEHRIFDLIGLVGEGVRLRHTATWEQLKSRGIHWAVIYPEWFYLLSTDPNAIPLREFVLERPTTAGSNRVVVYYKE